MANTIKVHEMLATAAAKVIADTSPLFTTVSREGERDFGKTVNAHKPGDTISVRVPALGTVQNGATAVPGDINEKVVPLTIDVRKNISFTLSTHEATLKMTDIERMVAPYAAQLAKSVHDELLTKINAGVANTVFKTASADDDYFDATALISEGMAPQMDRYALVSAREKARVGKALNNQWTMPTELSRKSTIGMFSGLEFNETASTPIITNGSKVAGLTTSGTQTAGASTITISSVAGDTFKKGQTFTIAGINGVNPLNGGDTGALRQFVITADVTAAGTGVVLPVYPALIVGQTITALPATATAVTFVGAANAVLGSGLVYNKDAFRLAFVSLQVPEDKVGYTLNKNGFSIRVYSGSDVTSDMSTTRLDIACGLAVVRPEFAARVIG
jgi:hypothetical protein